METAQRVRRRKYYVPLLSPAFQSLLHHVLRYLAGQIKPNLFDGVQRGAGTPLSSQGFADIMGIGLGTLGQVWSCLNRPDRVTSSGGPSFRVLAPSGLRVLGWWKRTYCIQGSGNSTSVDDL